MSIPQYLMGQVGQIDFSPAERALTHILKQQEMQKNYALQQERLGMDRERLGFDRQRMEREAAMDPIRINLLKGQLAQQQAELDFRRQTHPLDLDIRRNQLAQQRSELDFRNQSHPLDLRMKEAQLKALNEKGPIIKEVNGKIVRIMPDGTSNVLYDSGPNFDKLPEFAAKSAAFTTRMIDAERNIRETMLDPKKFDPTSMTTAFVRTMPEGFGNYALRGKEHQRYMQAAEQWIRAFLRKESGAAIGKDEFVRDFKVYFPQPGDSKEVIDQKAQARIRAMQGFAGETRGFHQHVDPRGHETLSEWLNPRVQKPAPIPRPGSEPVTITNPDEARKFGKGQRFIHNGIEYEVE